MLLEYIQNNLNYLHLIFKIYLIILVFIVEYMMLKMLSNAKVKIVINGFAMEKGMLSIIKIKLDKVKNIHNMDLT